MAYIALYRKWRPALFEDVIGQRHITETLQKAIDTDKVVHAYLFFGPRGTGKTSTAKIFAKAINCVHGPTSHPCNVCDVCRHITSGESLDVMEIDAASNRSIEDIRTLRETIKFMPAEGHKKIYIIDEVHMLTTEAFNALLKTLEEPPAHVIFIMATTEPEKVPMTILSRCQRYEFRRLTSSDIADRLLYIAGQEHIELTRGAAHVLAVQADGGMRDALSMLDQCVSNATGPIDETLVRDLLGLIGKDWIFSLSNAVFDGKGDAIVKLIDDIIHMGKEPKIILTELIMHLRAIMLYQAAPQSGTLSTYADTREALAKQAENISPHRVFAVLGILQQSLLIARTSAVPRVAVEMGVLMAARTLGSDQTESLSERITHLEEQAYHVPQSVLDRITRLESMIGNGAAVSVPESSDLQTTETDIQACHPKPEHAGLGVSAQKNETIAAPTGVEEVKTKNISETTAPAITGLQSRQEYDTIWKRVCDMLEEEKKHAVLSCMRNGRLAYIDNDAMIVAFKTAFMVKRANKADYCRCVEDALTAVTGHARHMQCFLEGDNELAVYEHKGQETAVPETVQDCKGHTEEAMQSKLKPVGLEEIPKKERAVLDPVLKTMKNCKLYVESDTDSDT